MNPKNLAPALLKDMKSKGVDIALSLEILDMLNDQDQPKPQAVKAKGVPEIDGRTVIDLREVGAAAVREFRYEANAFKARVESLGLDPKRFLDVWVLERI